MIVYVESNFVLEIAYEQEEARYAKEILTLTSNGVIKLAFSSFILSEPFESVLRRQSERNGALNSLGKTLRELQRSEPHKEIMLDIDPVINTISRDSEAFNNSSVKNELSLYNCRYIKSFRDGLQFIKSINNKTE